MSDHARKAVEIMERAEAERREALRNDPDDEPAAAPVPDGARAEYERLKRLLSTVRTGEDLADAEAGMDAIVLPLLSQPAASEWYEHAADVLAGWFKRYIGQEAPDGEVLASATDRLLCSQPAASEPHNRCSFCGEIAVGQFVLCGQHAPGAQPAAQQDALRAAAAEYGEACRELRRVLSMRMPPNVTLITRKRKAETALLRAALADTEAGNE